MVQVSSPLGGFPRTVPTSPVLMLTRLQRDLQARTPVSSGGLTRMNVSWYCVARPFAFPSNDIDAEVISDAYKPELPFSTPTAAQYTSDLAPIATVGRSAFRRISASVVGGRARFGCRSHAIQRLATRAIPALGTSPARSENRLSCVRAQ
jgi:hypothetical protein